MRGVVLTRRYSPGRRSPRGAFNSHAPSKDGSAERLLIAAVFHRAMDDLRTHIECNCVNMDRPTDFCSHAYRSARRFLLGTRPEWRVHRDLLCSLIDVLPERMQRRAMDVIATRKRLTHVWTEADVSAPRSDPANSAPVWLTPVGVVVNG